MELRHLRYFVAVAEAGSLTGAAAQRLHMAQPSLSRQIRDLEYEVGAQLLIRGARGIALTAAGRVFLDHARLALAQVEAAGAAARRAAQPAKPSFALGFLTGKEIDWLPDVLRLLRREAVLAGQHDDEGLHGDDLEPQRGCPGFASEERHVERAPDRHGPQAGLRSGPSGHGDVLRRLHAGRRTVTGLRPGSAAQVPDQPSLTGGGPHH